MLNPYKSETGSIVSSLFYRQGNWVIDSNFYFEIFICHYSRNSLHLSSLLDPLFPVFHFFLFLYLLPCLCCWERVNRNKMFEVFTSENVFILPSPLIGSLVGYRNYRLAIIFLLNFESITSLFSFFFSIMKSYMLLISDLSNVARGFCFSFSENLSNLCSQCFAVSSDGVLIRACFIHWRKLPHSFLLFSFLS